ncbi:NADH-quinone oxidoreductase subunit NuoE [Candidatus Woesearchaeota archaeon]|nr:NADH-quinone oxidoreductase subunit NuoE [Candidatus Woesearchaeota archaeon]
MVQDIILLNELRKVQDKEGYVSEKSARKINKKTGIPLSRIYAAATFYAKIHTEPQGKYVIEVCNSPSCYLNGSLNLIKYLVRKLKIKSGQTTKDKKFSLHISSCIGCCDEAPAMLLNDKPYTKLTKEKIDEILKKCK